MADGWLPSYQGDRAKLTEPTTRLDDAVAAAGRAPADLRRGLNIGEPGSDPAATADLLTSFVLDLGFDRFVLGGDPAGAGPFVDQVVPRVRDQVAAARR